MPRRSLGLAILVVALRGWPAAGSAHADTETKLESEETPWAKGVSPEDRKSAQELFNAGNQRYADGRYAEASALYAQALDKWAHPMVQFNSARALIYLGKPLEAFKELERAMSRGEAGIGAQKYEEGKTIRALLRGQLTELTIICDSDAEVSLDGERIAKTDGGDASIVLLLRPGAHQLVAERAGMLRFVERLELVAGSARAVEIAFEPIRPPASPPIYDRRWPRWQPWAVAGVGGSLLAGGIVLAVLSEENFDRFDEALAKEPACNAGCTETQLPASIRAFRDRGETQRTAAVAAAVVGTAALAAGIIWISKNDLRERRAGLQLSPTAGKRSVGLALHGEF